MRRAIYRRLYRVGGLIALGTGIVGVALPILPTVPFLILAAFCFSRSNPAWAERLHGHPRYGESLRNWRDRRAIGRKAKIAAVGAMAAGVVFTAITLGFPMVLISLALLMTVGPWIWTRAE